MTMIRSLVKTWDTVIKARETLRRVAPHVVYDMLANILKST